MKLDVGCGHQPKGIVNVDLFVEATNHRSDDQRECNDSPLNPKTIPNLIRADAQSLPFRDNVFDDAVSCHVIEHVPNPTRMLREMLRVVKPGGSIQVVCPHRMAHRRKKRLHINQFNLKWFKQTLRRLDTVQNSQIEYSNWKCLPHSAFALFRLPSEITVNARKIEGGVMFAD